MPDLGSLSTEERGLLFPVVIEDHKAAYRKLFKAEKKKILNAAGPGNILNIHHIGSTAVRGLCAKPTIDILIEITGQTDCDMLVRNLAGIGYSYIPRPENPPPHIMLAKGYSLKGYTGQTFHVHLRYKGDWDEIVFRDYLISHPQVAEKYGQLKKRLAAKHTYDRDRYTESKTRFITRIVKKARQKSKS